MSFDNLQAYEKIRYIINWLFRKSGPIRKSHHLIGLKHLTTVLIFYGIGPVCVETKMVDVKRIVFNTMTSFESVVFDVFSVSFSFLFSFFGKTRVVHQLINTILTALIVPYSKYWTSARATGPRKLGPYALASVQYFSVRSSKTVNIVLKHIIKS